MTDTIRFPLIAGKSGAGTSEAAEVVTLLNAVTTIPKGGTNPYVDVATPWKIDVVGTESPFSCIVVEFLATAAGTIGDGTNPICLFGEITLPTIGGTPLRTLLGILGTNFGGTTVPQIPMLTRSGDGALVGYSQIVSSVSCWDKLSIGALTGDVALAEGVTLTVTARPIHRRLYAG